MVNSGGLPRSGALSAPVLVAGVVAVLGVLVVDESDAEASCALSAATCCSDERSNSLVFCWSVFCVSSCFFASNNWAY